jgi:hypothetical protein
MNNEQEGVMNNLEGLKFIFENMTLRRVMIIDDAGQIKKFEGKRCRHKAANNSPWINGALNEWGKLIKKMALPLATASKCVLCDMDLREGLVCLPDAVNPYGINVDICDACELPYTSEYNPMLRSENGKEIVSFLLYPKVAMCIVPNDVLGLIREWLVAYNTVASMMNEMHPQWDGYVKLLKDIKRTNNKIREVIENVNNSNVMGESPVAEESAANILTENSDTVDLANSTIIDKGTENSVAVEPVFEAVSG